LTRFVGRAREFAVLEDLLGLAQEGRGQVVGVIGEPGVGTSRLCDELICRPRLQGWQILATSTTAYGQATPYLPVIDLLKACFQLEEQDALPTLRDKITAKLQTLDAAFEPSLPAFLSLLEVPVEEPAWQALDLAREQKTRGHEAHALCQLGAVHAHASSPDVPQAETCDREALTRAEA
jgi:predicted ATPase